MGREGRNTDTTASRTRTRGFHRRALRRLAGRRWQIALDGLATIHTNVVLKCVAIKRMLMRDDHDLGELLCNDSCREQIHKRLRALLIEGAQWLIQKNETRRNA